MAQTPNTTYGMIRSNPAGTKYTDNTLCAFNFVAPVGKMVELVFTSFNLGKNGGGDVVKVYKGTHPAKDVPPLLQRSGEGSSPLVISNIGLAYLIFQTHASGVYRMGGQLFLRYYILLLEIIKPNQNTNIGTVDAPPTSATYTCSPDTTVYDILVPSSYIRTNIGKEGSKVNLQTCFYFCTNSPNHIFNRPTSEKRNNLCYFMVVWN